MLKNFSEIYKGINGNPELSRLVGFFGGIVFIITTPAFVGYLIWKNGEFDLTAYCLTFPAGIAAIVTGTAKAIEWKDNGVARAKTVERTNSEPATPPEPAPRPLPSDPPIEEATL